MKKRQIVLYIVVMLILLATSVYATIQAELGFKLTADDNIFCPGEEFIITIGLKNLTATQGIKSIEGYIDINKDVLEDLTIDSIVKDDNGKVQIGTNNILDVYDANNISSQTEKGIIFNTNPVSEKGDYKIIINLENPISSDIDLVNVKFKIRSDISAGEYQSVMSYKLFNIFATDAGEKLELQPVTYRLTVSDSTTPVENFVEDTNNIPTNVPTNDSETPVNNTPENTPTNVPTNTPVNNTPTNTPKNTPVNNVPSNTPVNNTVKPVNNTTKPVNNTTKPINNTTNNNVENNTVKKVTNNSVNNVKNYTNSSNGNFVNKTDNSTSPSKLPKTGYRIVFIPIVAMIIVGLVFYKKYSKYNNYHE